MKPHPLLGAAIAFALCARAAPAQSSPASDLRAFAPPAATMSAPGALTLTLTSPDALSGLDFGIAAGYRSAVFLAPRGWVRYGPGFHGPRNAGVMYRPRRFGMSPWRRETVMYEPRRVAPPPPSTPPRQTSHASNPMSVPIQLHGGFFAHDENAPRSYAMGLRGGPAIDKHLQIGVGVDWYHRTDSERLVVSDTMQAGQPITKTRVLSQASTDQIPIQAFLQLSVGRGLVPYAGIGGGYQFLLLSATDHVTGAEYNATFGGLSWQAWGGLGLDLGRSRLFGELFINAGDVERDLQDPSGTTYAETINADGGGARFGLSWGF